MKRNGSARLPFVVGIMFCLMLFLGLPLLWIMGAKARLQQAEKEVVKERQIARAAHLPLTAKDMERNPPVADANNAAPIYRQIGSNFKAKAAQITPLEKTALEITKPNTPPASIADARKLVALCQPELALMEQAAQKPACDFKRDWDRGPDLLLPEYADMRKMARLVAIKAELLERDGKPMEALKQIEIGSKMVQHLSEEPILIGMLVQIALEAILDREWHNLVNRHWQDASFLTRAEQVSKGFGKLPDFRNAMRGEVIMGIVAIRMIREKKFDTNQIVNQSGGNEQSPKMQFSAESAPIFEKNLLSYWRKAFAAMNEAQGSALQVAQAMDKVAKEEEVEIKKDPAGHALNAILMPVFSQAGNKTVHVEAMRKLRELKILLLQRRAKHGSFPADLSGFDAKLTTDPFTGKPLHYKRENNGFRLWSVGANGVDDGGQRKVGNDGAADVVTSFPLND